MKIKLSHVLLGAVVLVGQNSLADSGFGSSDYSYLPYLQIGGTQFFNVGNAKSAGGADLFIPIWQLPSQLVFTHLRYFDRAGKPFEGNAHLGYRYLNQESEQLYGVYGAFDRKHTEFGNYFSQLTFGLEGWFQHLFVGGNFYQPIGNTSELVSITESGKLDRIQNNIWVTTNQQYEKAMAGGDVEIGYEVIKGLVGYVGGYYFSASDVNTMVGPKARITYDWSLNSGKRVLGIFDKFGLEGGVQRDNPRGITYYLSANFRIGLLPNQDSNLSGVARHMVDLIRRDVDIVSGSSVQTSREVARDEYGNIVTIKEVTDDPLSRKVDERNLSQVLADPNTQIVSIKGRIENLTANTVESVVGTKMVVFGNTLDVFSPTTGKRLAVDISAANGVTGTISKSARDVLSSIGDENKAVRSVKDQSDESISGITIKVPDRKSVESGRNARVVPEVRKPEAKVPEFNGPPQSFLKEQTKLVQKSSDESQPQPIGATQKEPVGVPILLPKTNPATPEVTQGSMVSPGVTTASASIIGAMPQGKDLVSPGVGVVSKKIASAMDQARDSVSSYLSRSKTEQHQRTPATLPETNPVASNTTSSMVSPGVDKVSATVIAAIPQGKEFVSFGVSKVSQKFASVIGKVGGSLKSSLFGSGTETNPVASDATSSMVSPGVDKVSATVIAAIPQGKEFVSFGVSKVSQKIASVIGKVGGSLKSSLFGSGTETNPAVPDATSSMVSPGVDKVSATVIAAIPQGKEFVSPGVSEASDYISSRVPPVSMFLTEKTTFVPLWNKYGTQVIAGLKGITDKGIDMVTFPVRGVINWFKS